MYLLKWYLWHTVSWRNIDLHVNGYSGGRETGLLIAMFGNVDLFISFCVFMFYYLLWCLYFITCLWAILIEHILLHHFLHCRESYTLTTYIILQFIIVLHLLASFYIFTKTCEWKVSHKYYISILHYNIEIIQYNLLKYISFADLLYVKC